MTYYETAQAPNGVNYFKQVDKFPNGFKSWAETHFEIVSAISLFANETDEDKIPDIISFTYRMGGRWALYELAEEWTNQFEERNKNRDWYGEFFDEIEQFITEKINGSEASSQ